MKLSCLTLFLAIMVLLLFPLSTTAFSQGDQESFASVDQLLNQGENQQALQLLQELPDPLPGKLWRLSRVQYEMGRIAESKSRRMEFFRQAEKYARAAITTDSNNSEGFKWLAIALGAQSKYSATKDQIYQSREIKENIEKSLELNPDDDISYLVLSRWNYKISALGFFSRAIVKIVYGGLPEASLDEAESLLWQAIKLHDRITHRYNLAKVYHRMDRRKDAVDQLQQALSLPVTFPEEVEEQSKAKRKLRKWQ
ncbi:MAG: hypothetical protein KAG93_06255 [Desulfuromusa sp.]|nr:hypothetical protein [Desulfuromusa sp.]